jgi:hypothetical protein
VTKFNKMIRMIRSSVLYTCDAQVSCYCAIHCSTSIVII